MINYFWLLYLLDKCKLNLYVEYSRTRYIDHNDEKKKDFFYFQILRFLFKR